jgi:hypothetical protein
MREVVDQADLVVGLVRHRALLKWAKEHGDFGGRLVDFVNVERVRG